jgi:hypothetical protein
VEKCVACQFYDRQLAKTNDSKGAMWGQCRRAAPMLHPINAKSYMIEGVWPHVRDDDWCGEWKQIVRSTEARPSDSTSTGPLLPGGGIPAASPHRPGSLAALPLGSTNGMGFSSGSPAYGGTMASPSRGAVGRSDVTPLADLTPVGRGD